MDKSEIEKYGDFRKAIAKELKRQLGAATKTGVDEIVKRILLADVGVYDNTNLEIMKHYLKPDSRGLVTVIDDHHSDWKWGLNKHRG